MRTKRKKTRRRNSKKENVLSVIFLTKYISLQGHESKFTARVDRKVNIGFWRFFAHQNDDSHLKPAQSGLELGKLKSSASLPLSLHHVLLCVHRRAHLPRPIECDVTCKSVHGRPDARLLGMTSSGSLGGAGAIDLELKLDLDLDLELELELVLEPEHDSIFIWHSAHSRLILQFDLVSLTLSRSYRLFLLLFLFLLFLFLFLLFLFLSSFSFL